MKLVIVESPAKAKTIEKYLGKGYSVMASVGHVRDLPKSNKDAVDIEGGFVPRYVVSAGKAEVIARIETAALKADEILLATDPDREGEAIAWHLAELISGKLKSRGKSKIKRVTYNEITKEAIQEALENPREIDQNLRKAQEARRVLDRLVGYDLSGLIWKKVRYGLSAGRVQSPALRIIVEREREIRAFNPEQYFVITAEFKTKKKELFTATAVIEPKKKEEADAIVSNGEKSTWVVGDVTESPVKRTPRPPFTTSTLQQTASSRLGFSPSRTMRAAQKLYEAGHITYMRTDSTSLAASAIGSIASFVKKEYGEKYLETRAYKTTSKNAQEAHEAVRPTDISHQNAGTTEDEHKLYRLIRARTLASQMTDAVMTRTKIIARADNKNVPEFTANGSTIAFDGWLKADPAAKGEDVILPTVSKDEPLALQKIESEEKFTEPPARYTEAGLVKELEKRGIGRPSTYASIIKTIVDREYVLKDGRALKPTAVGEVVDTFLEDHFAKYISDSFTAEMENELDQIASGERGYEETLRDFYKPFSKDVAAKEDAPKVTTLGNAPKEFLCPDCNADMVMKLGRGGVFMSCSRFPDCKGSRSETGEALKDAEPIGQHPETGMPIFVKKGKFGPYLEMPDKAADSEQSTADSGSKKETKRKKKIKIAAQRASIPKEINPTEITLVQAIKLLSLPRVLGTHPDTNDTITANNGKFGPYIVHQADFRSLKGADTPYDITYERALEILKEPKKTRPGAPTVVKTIGEHPRTKKPILLFQSKSGYFLKKGFKRIPVLENQVETISAAEAADLLKNS
ncbi:DNA topoisomerase I [Candidatus Kaiserbacteria bacterium RIFCSPHIGHO2_01_FULL_48_10]|uniref:DNA topoisomerase 1 n=1 Tax=Candidatus Kaiserbacteria bacterium RIFCSPHIGHO2_01_FULL_48_10 TaxID=1798476 RepID=A0A1F6C695_9BACT|nr:MAG: DNA topoisomerase I [Candidatus Kaiserbacteria bacterium RIFCSPHIGHO2_01_FULL_48_10]